ncbi:MAG: hypothetical protein JW966_06575 [Anaerolineae bacterium]|nr:hypothetical protein [Anaerolineae bacterium]
MLPFALISALVLLAVTCIVIQRALAYVNAHPEITSRGSPVSYQRCHTTLLDVIERYHQIRNQIEAGLHVSWQSPLGGYYTIDHSGVTEHWLSSQKTAGHLPWHRISGVGIRMQPGFRFIRPDMDTTSHNSVTTGYSFHVLVVPLSGRTMDIIIPIDGQNDAISFVAYMVALAENRGKRINTLGFDKPPASRRQKGSRF